MNSNEYITRNYMFSPFDLYKIMFFLYSIEDCKFGISMRGEYPGTIWVNAHREIHKGFISKVAKLEVNTVS